MSAALYLIPCPIGDVPAEHVLPRHNAEIVRNIRHFIVESRKSAVRFLLSLIPDFPVDECTFSELNEHTAEKTDIAPLLEPLLHGSDMGIISDAGCPCIGDPGARAVEIAQKRKCTVVPLVGPSSLILALMASGFNGQNFSFSGYLPVKNGERESKIRQLEARMYKENQTQLFIEAPYRNEKLFDALLKTCRPDTKLCVAAGLTTAQEYTATKTIADWKKSKQPDIAKIPTLFLLYK